MFGRFLDLMFVQLVLNRIRSKKYIVPKNGIKRMKGVTALYMREFLLYFGDGMIKLESGPLNVIMDSDTSGNSRKVQPNYGYN